MKQVDFNYVNFDEYVKINLAIEEAGNKCLDEDVVNEMYEQKKKYEYNLSLYFEVVASNKGLKFAKKGHHELNERLNKKINSSDENLSNDMLVGNSWRYGVGEFAIVERVSTEGHPFEPGDRVKIMTLEDGINNYSYMVIHESSNEHSLFIINDEELV